MIPNYLTAVLGLCAIIAAPSTAQDKDDAVQPPIGVCISSGQQAEAHDAGFDFIVPGVAGYLKPTSSNIELPPAGDGEQTIPVFACNVFLPSQMKCVGPGVRMDSLLAYAETVFRRAKQRGVPTIIFGSGAARKIPDGYDRERATAQFVELCTQLAQLAASYDVNIALENLNREETNLVNTVEEARAVCEAVAMPNFGVNADIYHMLKEHEPPENLLKASVHIMACDIAEPGNRTPPGVEGTDFGPYLEALRQINYQGGIAVEARWTDFSSQAANTYQALKKQLDTVYQ